MHSTFFTATGKSTAPEYKREKQNEHEESEASLPRKSMEECRAKREEEEEEEEEAQEHRLHSLERRIEAKEKQLASVRRQLDRDIDAKEREYGAVRRRVEERNRELEAQDKQLESIQRKIAECERQLRLKEEECNWHLEKVHRVIIERDEVYQKMQRAIQECDHDLVEKEARLCLIVDLIVEREQELKTKDMEFHQVLDSIHRERERKGEELRALTNKVAERNEELRTKEEELDAVQRLINGQGNEVELKTKSLVKSMRGRINQLDRELGSSRKEEKVLKEKSNILLHQAKTEQQHFTDASSANNSKNLQLLFNLLEKYELISSQVSDALRTSADPTKLVLDTIKGFYTPHSRQELIEYDANISRRICNLLMDELKKSLPVIGVHVKQEAMKLASDWMANIAVPDKDCLEVLDFFKFVATYEIGSCLNAIELQRLLDIFAQHCQTPQALGNIEKPPGNQLSPTIDGRNLQLPYIEHTNEPELIDDDILVTLQTSSDPAKLVLDIIQNPIVPQNKGNEGVIIDGSHIFLLEQLMRISPHVKPHVREEALKLALDLKANMRESAKNSLMILGFLLLLSNYGLASDFNEDEVLKLLEVAAQHKEAVELFRTLGFVDKISDFVQNLIEKQQHIEAVRFICTYKLADKIQPVDLLQQHMAKAKLITKRFVGKKKSIEKKVKARDREIASLGTVLQCISDNHLESQDLVNEIQDRILELERQKENIIRSASEPSSKVEEQLPEEKERANEVVTKNQVKVEQPEEKKHANAAVIKNQVKAEEKKRAIGAVTKNQVKMQQSRKKKRANAAFIKNQVKVQHPEEKKPTDGVVTLNQGELQQAEEKLCANEAVIENQVQVHKPEEKKRAIGALPNDHQWGNIRKRPRTAVTRSLPSVFTPHQYQHVFMPMPPQFGLPTNYFDLANPMGVGRFGNSGTNYFGQLIDTKLQSTASITCMANWYPRDERILAYTVHAQEYKYGWSRNESHVYGSCLIGYACGIPLSFFIISFVPLWFGFLGTV
ncbi:FRIGIDA protein 3 [Spatholobus suberectus]|nr:FRIGIDA protein 3 [Spatholobus suberectus]